ncbi:MAG: YggU family protein [Planctomycetaceae bacterium]|nr:YggU family protein [Planctomycetaceae bacterium]
MHYSWDGDNLILLVRITPRASRNQVCGLMGDRLKISVTAPPVDGEANAGLVKFLAAEFRVAKSCVDVVSGQMNRNKTVRIISPAQLPDSFQVRRP